MDPTNSASSELWLVRVGEIWELQKNHELVSEFAKLCELHKKNCEFNRVCHNVLYLQTDRTVVNLELQT